MIDSFFFFFSNNIRVSTLCVLKPPAKRTVHMQKGFFDIPDEGNPSLSDGSISDGENEFSSGFFGSGRSQDPNSCMGGSSISPRVCLCVNSNMNGGFSAAFGGGHATLETKQSLEYEKNG